MKVLIEGISLIGLILIVKMKADPRTIGWEKVKDVLAPAEVINYLQKFWPIFYGWYISFVGHEIITVMFGLTQDVP